MTKMIKSIVPVALALFLLGTRAHAAGDVDVQGVACVPVSTTSYGTRWLTTNVGVTFNSGISGWIDFYCGIPHASDMATPTTLEITYTDSSATAGNQVIVTYYKQHKTNGTLTNIATVFSDNCAVGFSTCSTTFTDTFDPSTYRYFLAASLNSNGGSEIFWGATVR
jgi:hypothetical protein